MTTPTELEPAAIRAAHERIDPVATRSARYVHEGPGVRRRGTGNLRGDVCADHRRQRPNRSMGEG